MTAIGEIFLRFAVALAAFCISLAIAQKFAGYSVMTRRHRRQWQWIQDVSVALFLACSAWEYVVYWQGSTATNWGQRLFALAWPAYIVWGLNLIVISLGIAWYSLKWQGQFASLAASCASALEHPAVDQRYARELVRRADELIKAFPMASRSQLGRARDLLASRLDKITEADVKNNIEHLLELGDPGGALKWIARAGDYSLERLLVAMECEDWKECLDFIRRNPDNPVAAEALQLMADRTSVEDYRRAALSLMDHESNRRRLAALELRHGSRERASALLSADWEARVWVKAHRTE